MRALRIFERSCTSPSASSIERNSIRHYGSGSNRLLPSSPARTRFAPSPTGYLHLGSLRTALFNYLLAKKTGGQFLLRIEDTDQRRTVAGAEERLCKDLQWAGLQWDEGPGIGGPYGPYRQSERTELYRDHANKLVESGYAYRCFCTAQRLDELARARKELGLPPDYDRLCHGLTKAESDEKVFNRERHVIRLVSPDTYPVVKDLVYGVVGKTTDGVTFKHGEITYEDPILLKTDGFPTYHLANVVDDHLMEITHVVRATEWLSSTPKHLAIYKAFNWQPPKFAHVGLLTDATGAKLSKRNFDTDVAAYRDKWGALPSALNNFLALLGWSHRQKSDVMDMQKLLDVFEMSFTRGSTVVTFDKLWYLQRTHAANAAKSMSSEFHAIVENVCNYLRINLHVTETFNGRDIRKYVTELVRADAKGFENLESFCKRNRFFFFHPEWPPYFNEDPNLGTTAQLRKALEGLFSASDESWTNHIWKDSVNVIVDQICEETSQASKRDIQAHVNKYIRWVLLAGNQGPTLGATIQILGPEVCRKRLHDSAQVEG